MRIIILVLAFTSLFMEGIGQQSNIFISTGVGISTSHMDIQSDNGFYGSMGVGFNLNKALQIELLGGIGALNGKETQNGDTYSFTNNISQVAACGNLFLLPLLGKPSDKIDLYASVGGQLLISNVSTINTPASDPWANAYSGVDFMLPIGGGIILPLSNAISLRLSVLYHYSFSDDLDGYNPQVAANQADDQFSNVGFSIVFRPGKAKLPTKDNQPVQTKDMVVQEEERERSRPTTTSPQVQQTAPIEPEEPVIADEQKAQTLTTTAKNNSSEPEDNTEQATQPVTQQENQTANTAATAPGTTSTNSNLASPNPDNVDNEAASAKIASSNNMDNQATGKPTNVTPEDNVMTEIEDVAPRIFADALFTISGRRAEYVYYIIGGSFSSMAKAEAFQYEQADKGFASVVLLDQAKERYRVSFGSFDSYQEAQSKLADFKKTIDQNCWIIQNSKTR